MADFATVVKELESQNKVLSDIKRNTAKPKKDAGDRETERENAASAGRQQSTLEGILAAVKMGSNPPASKGGGKSGSGFNLGSLLKGGAILGGLAGLAKAIMNFIMNPFGILLKAGKWILKAPFRLAAWSIKKLAKAASSAIWGALKMGWGFTKKLLKTPLTALKAVGQSLKTLATRASSAIGGALKSGWGFLKDFAAPKLKAVGESLKTLATRASDAIKGGLKAGWGFAKDMTLKAVDLGKNALTKTTTFLKNMGSKGLEAAKGGMKTAWGFAKDGTMKAIDLGKNAASGLKDIALKASSSVSNAIGSLWQGAKGASGKVLTGVQQAAAWGMSKATHGLGMLKTFATNGISAVKGAITSVMPNITGVATTAGKVTKGAAGTIAKTLLTGAKVGAKLIPGVGLAVTGALALYDGFKAGFDTYKETGNFGQAVKDGAAGALSSLTFGLVSKETISAGFSAVGDKYSELTTGVKNLATKAWTGVKSLIPTKEDMTKAWNAVGDKLAPLKNIVLPKEFSVEAVKTSLSSVGTSLNAAVKNMTGLDIGSITTKFPSLESIKDMLPNWLTNPVGWVTSWFKDAEAPRNPEELKTREYQATLEESQDRVRRLEAQLARTKQVENRGYGQSGMEKRIAKAQEELRLSKLYVSSGGKEGKETVWNVRGSDIEAEKGDFANKADRIKKLQARLTKMKADDEATHKEIAKHNAIIAEQQQKIAAIKKHTGGTFTSRSNFLIAPGEMMINPQSSGLVLNRSATNAIMSAGLNRIATANQGDAQGGGGSPTLINAPRVNNSQVTNNTIPIRRSLPIVPSMVG